VRDCVIDLSHFNGLHLDFVKAKAAGIEGVIHKATQGTRYADPRMLENRRAVLEAGLLFGAYHFGTGSTTGKDQADYFLETVPQGGLLVLDFEPNPQGSTMSVRQAQDFCAAVEVHTKKPITIYTGAPMMPQAIQLGSGAFGQRPLWWAAYRRAPSNAPSGWPMALWQYSDHAQVDGIGFCDRNEFFGEDLKQFWEGSAFAGVTSGVKGEVA